MHQVPPRCVETANEGGSDLLHRSFGDWNESYLGNLESLQCFYAIMPCHGIWIFIFREFLYLRWRNLSDTTFGKQKLEVEQSLWNWIAEFWYPISQPAQLVADNAFWMFHSAIYHYLMLQFSASLFPTATQCRSVGSILNTHGWWDAHWNRVRVQDSISFSYFRPNFRHENIDGSKMTFQQIRSWDSFPKKWTSTTF